jgi:NOL1/NOP2/fmu family ribosome biogenesis protein
VLLYSTCSFELAEDEEQVRSFLDRHADFKLDEAVTHPSVTRGIGLERTARIWPHRSPGNGQFVARLVREGRAEEQPGRREARWPGRAALEAWRAFRGETLPGFETQDDAIAAVGETLYLVPEAGRDLEHLSRPGLPLGRLRPGRFEPAAALATAVKPEHAAQHVQHTPEYLRGETTESPGPDGWVLVTYERWGLGWARRTGGTLKNFFPKALRRRH